MTHDITSTEYKNWIIDLKSRFRKAQIKAALKVNSTLLEFYWELGADIIERQKTVKWGSGFLKQLSADLMEEFPDVKGFSVNNLQYIVRWFSFYTNVEQLVPHLKKQITKQDVKQLTGDSKANFDPTCAAENESSAKRITACYPIGKQAVSQLENSSVNIMATSCCQITKQVVPHFNQDLLFQIPWGQNIVIISKCNSVEEALFYVNKTIENGWSRAVLTHQIESELFNRQGTAVTNFSKTLPEPQSDLAQQLIKDPYNFDFLTLTSDYNEKELEKNLTDHITKFLMELGAGFAYMGKQVPIQVGERDFFLDLLFYHTKLHCHVVIELKVVDFEPEHAGKLNFYIKAVDEQLRQVGDNPTIGILLCKNRDKLVAEYALSDINKPMGVTEYELTQSLPEQFKSSLPTIEEIEAEIKL